MTGAGRLDGNILALVATDHKFMFVDDILGNVINIHDATIFLIGEGRRILPSKEVEGTMRGVHGRVKRTKFEAIELAVNECGRVSLLGSLLLKLSMDNGLWRFKVVLPRVYFDKIRILCRYCGYEPYAIVFIWAEPHTLETFFGSLLPFKTVDFVTCAGIPDAEVVGRR